MGEKERIVSDQRIRWREAMAMASSSNQLSTESRSIVNLQEHRAAHAMKSQLGRASCWPSYQGPRRQRWREPESAAAPDAPPVRECESESPQATAPQLQDRPVPA